MAFGWKQASEQSGAEKIGPGVHQVKVGKIVTGSKAGPFKSKKDGAPQVMVVYESATGAEAAEMLTLSDKAAWTLARLLSRVGVNLEEMEAAGVEPRHFAQKELAESYLLGKPCWIKVAHEVGNDGKVLTRVTPMHESEANGALPPEGDEIPF